MPVIIHKTAEVSPDAVIGKDVTVWNHSQIMAGAAIGDSCKIGHNCLVASGAVIGNGVKIQANTDIWNKVTLEDYVFVGPSAVFTNDINPRAKYPKPKEEWFPTLVKTGATIGANATIVCRTTIGKWAFVAAGSVVVKDVPDYALVAGVPAKSIGWVCECGEKLEFKPIKLVKFIKLGKKKEEAREAAECSVCKRCYQKNELNVEQITQ